MKTSVLVALDLVCSSASLAQAPSPDVKFIADTLVVQADGRYEADGDALDGEAEEHGQARQAAGQHPHERVDPLDGDAEHGGPIRRFGRRPDGDTDAALNYKRTVGKRPRTWHIFFDRAGMTWSDGNHSFDPCS